MYRQNNTLYSATTSPLINLTYVPSEGPDGNLTINGEGDLETKSDTEMLPFLCQFSDGEYWETLGLKLVALPHFLPPLPTPPLPPSTPLSPLPRSSAYYCF